jgi:hypothetical protein
MTGESDRPDVSRRAVLLVSLFVLAPVVSAAVAAPGAAQRGGCVAPAYSVVPGADRPAVLATSSGCPDAVYTYDEAWRPERTTLDVRAGPNATAEARDAAPASDGGWWLLGAEALYRLHPNWTATGRTVALPTANGTTAPTPAATGEFRSVARTDDGRLWLAGPEGDVAVDPANGTARPVDLPRVDGLHAAGDRLWTLRGTARGGVVRAYAVPAEEGNLTAERRVRIGPEVRRPVDLTRVGDEWVVVSAERVLFVYGADWTYTGERRGSSGVVAAAALLATPALLVAFGAVVVVRLRRELLPRFLFVAVTSTLLAVAVRQSLLPPAARSLYALPGVAVAGVLLAPWALAVATLRKGPRAVLAVILLLGAGVALPVASEYVIAV